MTDAEEIAVLKDQINELLKQNEELKKENDVLIDGLGCKTCSIYLEYENEELKKQIEKMKCCTNCKWHKVFCELQEPCEGYWNNWELAE